MENSVESQSDDDEDLEKVKLYSTIERLTTACESYRSEIERQEDKNAKELTKVNREVERLQLELCRQQDRLEHWKTTCLRQQNENLLIAKSKLISRENSALRQDTDVLKSVIQRLSRELAFYQAKLHKCNQYSPESIPQFPNSTDDSDKDDLLRPRLTLAPLLTAYDEVIKDKGEIINEHERIIDEFKLRLRQIIQENEQLRAIISECKGKGTVSNEEWKSLYDNALLVLEENDLFHDKVGSMQLHLETIEASHEQRVEKLKQRLGTLEDEKLKLKNGVSEMDLQCTKLREQMTEMNRMIQQRIPKEEHESSINECQQLFNALKNKYNEERTLLTQKASELGVEKERLHTQLNTSNSEITRLGDAIKNLEKSNLEYAGTLIVLKKELSISLKALQLHDKNIKESVHKAETMALEKNALEKSYTEHRQSTAKIMAVRSQEMALIRDCKLKLQSVVDEYEKKLEVQSSRTKKLEDVLEAVAERHHTDLSRLQELVNEKDIHIEKLTIEKKQLTEDLETVWLATRKERHCVAQQQLKPNAN